MTDCPNAEMRDRLPLLAAGRLDASARAEVEAHLAGCAECRAELALLRRVRETTARAPQVDVARIAAAVRGSARSARVAPPRRSAAWRRWRLPAAAAAAAVLALLAYDGERSATTDEPATASAASAERVPASGLTFGGGFVDLSAEELEQLVASLDEIDPLPDAEPRSLLPDIPLELEGTL